MSIIRRSEFISAYFAEPAFIDEHPTGGEYDGVTPIALVVESYDIWSLQYQWYASIDARSPLILVVDGAHTADDTTIDFVDASGVNPNDLLVGDFVGKEIMRVISVDANTITVERGVLGTPVDELDNLDEFVHWTYLDGADEPTYLAEPDIATDYRAVVRNPFGFAISSAAAVTVL